MELDPPKYHIHILLEASLVIVGGPIATYHIIFIYPIRSESYSSWLPHCNVSRTGTESEYLEKVQGQLIASFVEAFSSSIVI